MNINASKYEVDAKGKLVPKDDEADRVLREGTRDEMGLTQPELDELYREYGVE